MSEFEFPTNIRQIGSIGAGMKIYMEDYACSYLQQYAALGGYDERLAFLIGRHMIIDNADVLFISGAVEGKDACLANGILTLGNLSFDYAKEQIEKHFESQEIVGWMQSQPGYGTFLNDNYAKYHRETFKKPHQVMFIMDPIEKLNSFYWFDKSKDGLAESRGYFIYYEKNTGMHEYMLQNKSAVNEDGEKAIKPSPGEIKKDDIGDITGTPYFKRLREPNGLNRYDRIPVSGQREKKSVVSLLSTLCAVLVLVCVAMGMGLMQNGGMITTLEGQLVDINTLYKNLLVQSKQNVQPVFAASDENSIEETAPSASPGEAVIPGAADETDISNDIEAARASSGSGEGVITLDGGALEVPQQDITENPAGNTGEEVTQSPSPDIPETYIVQEGDNLNYISMKFYGSTGMVGKIMEANEIENADTIYFGKVLILPRV